MIEEKSWTAQAEEKISREWANSSPYDFEIDNEKPTYSIDTPPPYINTPIHIGHATTYTLMDMFARYKRMMGYNVLFPLGLDKNGLPIEMATEKKFGVKLKDMDREKFLELCAKMLEEAGAASLNSFQRLGIGFNSWKIGTGVGEIYETDSSDYRRLTQDTFIDLWNKGLIYEDERVNNYCPGCQTTLADAEVEYAELNSHWNEIKFKVVGSDEEIIIGTTRPELICTCAMVIFNPEDERYKHLEGKHAITPMFGKKVPIKGHPYASMEKGTGLVMMCSMGDTNDIRFFREMGLEPVIAISKEGLMNDNAGFLQGLKVLDARKKMIESLKEKELLISQKQALHRTPICERSKEPIEFISMRELYVKQLDFKDKLKELAKELVFHDDSSRQIMLDWIDAIAIDWPISRRRYYATEVPLWYCNGCSEVIVPPKGKYYRPWKESPPIKVCSCGSTKFEGDKRVFDTWFDSSNSPLYILQYSKDDKFFSENSPCALRPQGKEIIRTWLYYTVLKGYLLTGKLIFKEAWINYHVVDDKGHKMSKSKGNVIEPQEILNKYGAEPFRLWCAIEGNLDTTDFRCSFDRIEGAGKTIIKLWNVAKFISSFERPTKVLKLMPLDKWILNELNELVDDSRSRFDEYDFHNPAQRIKHFVWETFASHYLELVKNRAYNQEQAYSKDEQDAALHTLHHCLDTILKLLAPIIPMVTYRLFMELNQRDVHFEDFPESAVKLEQPFTTQQLVEFNSAVWKTKKDAGKSLKAEISFAEIPESLKLLEKDLIKTHSIKEVMWAKESRVVL